MPQQLDAVTVDDKAALLRKKADRRRGADDKSIARRRKDESERPVRQPRRRSTGNQPSSEATTAELVNVPSRESKLQRPRSSRQGSSSRIQGDLMSPRSVKREERSSLAAPALAPSSRDSPRRARQRCTKTAEASILPSASIKMRERRSSLPSAASIRSPFKRSRERRPSLSSNTFLNTAPKLDPHIAPSHAVAEKDALSKIAPSRRMHRRRTIATARVETDSSSEEQPVRIPKPKVALKKGSSGTKEGTSDKTRISRRASAVGSSEPTEKLTESAGKNLRLKSTRHSSSKSLGVAPQQTTTKPSNRRSRSSSMQHVSLQQQSEALKSLSGEAFRQAFVSVSDKGASSTEGATSGSKSSKGRAPSSETSKVTSPRKLKTPSKEKKSKPLSNGFEDEDDDTSLNILDASQPDVENGEGFFAVRSFLYEQ